MLYLAFNLAAVIDCLGVKSDQQFQNISIAGSCMKSEMSCWQLVLLLCFRFTWTNLEIWSRILGKRETTCVQPS